MSAEELTAKLMAKGLSKSDSINIAMSLYIDAAKERDELKLQLHESLVRERYYKRISGLVPCENCDDHFQIDQLRLSKDGCRLCDKCWNDLKGKDDER